METRVISTRVSSVRYEELQRQARVAGKTLAEYVREILEPQVCGEISGHIYYGRVNARNFVRVEVTTGNGQREGWQRFFNSEDEVREKLDELKSNARKWVALKFGLEFSETLTFECDEESMNGLSHLRRPLVKESPSVSS